jgi:hypothetical protein
LRILLITGTIIASTTTITIIRIARKSCRGAQPAGRARVRSAAAGCFSQEVDFIG